MKITIHYEGLEIYAEAYTDSTHIEDSVRIKRSRDMRAVLELIRLKLTGESLFSVNRLGLGTMVAEWRAHNLLYALGVARKRTQDVDLNDNPWWLRLAYGVLSCLYWHR